MTKTHDGPAAGQTFLIRRAPWLLRVVQAPDGKWDALDQIDDHPHPGERIWVYRIQGEAGIAHIDRTNPRTGRREGIWAAFADYYLHSEQPPDEIARANPLWQQWAQGQLHAAKQAAKAATATKP